MRYSLFNHINNVINGKEFTAEDKCPRWEKPYEWKRMTKKKRAESHFKQICDSLQGKYFTYEILND